MAEVVDVHEQDTGELVWHDQLYYHQLKHDLSQQEHTHAKPVALVDLAPPLLVVVDLIYVAVVVVVVVVVVQTIKPLAQLYDDMAA